MHRRHLHESWLSHPLHPSKRYQRLVLAVRNSRMSCRDQASSGYCITAHPPIDCQFILLSPVLFLAQDDVLLPRLARFLSAEECLPFPPRALVIVFVTGDILTVLAQLAGTALTITFGELVSIGVKVRRTSTIPNWPG